jgi:rare lipoprotein A
LTLRIASLALVALVAMMPTKPVKGGQVFASWYGNELAGSPTASGEPFNPSGMTAASKTLPLGTRLTVCRDGCVQVRVNDRGPYVAGRELDLSEGAAKSIGLDGVGTVEIKDSAGPITHLPSTGGPGQ